MKKYLLVLVSYVLITFIWAFVFNEIAFKAQLSTLLPSLRETPIFALGFVTMFLQTIIIYILYIKFFKGDKPLQESLTLIYLVGSFDILVTSLIIPATIIVNPVWKYILLKIVYGVVHYGMAGVVLAFIFKTSDQKGIQT